MDTNFNDSVIVLVRDSVSGKGLKVAENLLNDGIKVMINGEKQNDVIQTMFNLAHKYDSSLIFGVPGKIFSVKEYENFYGTPVISSVVHA